MNKLTTGILGSSSDLIPMINHFSKKFLDFFQKLKTIYNIKSKNYNFLDRLEHEIFNDIICNFQYTAKAIANIAKKFTTLENGKI